MATNITDMTWRYPHTDPDLEIVGWKGLVQVMVDIHGPNLAGALFNPDFKNIRTGKLISKPHHCTHEYPQCHAMVRNCVLKGHQSYCLQRIDAGDHRIRCGERLKVVSNGCGTHTNDMNNSMNLLIKNLKEDKIDSIRWGQINDPRRVSIAFKSPAEIAEEKNLTMVAERDVNLAKMREGEEVDPGQYSVHPKFEKKKAERQREEQEQRKCEAAQKREKANSKAVKEAADEVEVPSLPKGLGRTILKSIWGGDFDNLVKRCSNWHSTAEAIFSNDLVDVFPLVNADLSRFLFNMHYQVPRAFPLIGHWKDVGDLGLNIKDRLQVFPHNVHVIHVDFEKESAAAVNEYTWFVCRHTLPPADQGLSELLIPRAWRLF